MARQKRNIHAYDIAVEDFSLSSLPLQSVSAASHGISVVVFNEMLYYVKHKAIMQKFQRLLNPNGIVVISNWFAPGGKRTFIDEMLRTIFSDASLTFQPKDHIIVSGTREDSKEEVAVKIGVFTQKAIADSSIDTSSSLAIIAPPQPRHAQSFKTHASGNQRSNWLPSAGDLEDSSQSSFDSAFSQTIVKSIPITKATAQELKELDSSSSSGDSTSQTNTNHLRHRNQHNHKHNNQHMKNNNAFSGSISRQDTSGSNLGEHGQLQRERQSGRKRQGRKFDLTGEGVQVARKSASNTAEVVQNLNNH
jgi:hypothetical protein